VQFTRRPPGIGAIRSLVECVHLPKSSNMPQSAGIPVHPCGRHSDKISALGFGGHQLGDAIDEQTCVRLIHEEILLGKALKGRRDRVFLMTKVCTHGRDKALALRMLEGSLTRLQTDRLDLWQIQGVSFDNDADLFIRPGGAAETLQQAGVFFDAVAKPFTAEQMQHIREPLPFPRF
jgi:hypothetical protein